MTTSLSILCGLAVDGIFERFLDATVHMAIVGERRIWNFHVGVLQASMISEVYVSMS